MAFAWLTALTLNTWAQVGSNTANDVDPNDDPAINPNHPSAAPWRNSYDVTDIANQWNGGALDDVNGVFWTGGGGHSGYYGNELYSISLEADSPAWIRRGYPSGSIQKPCASFTTGLTASGSLLVDGRPAPVHTYNLFCAINNGDVALAGGGFNALGNNTGWGYKFSSALNDWDTTTPLNVWYQSYSCACYDPVRNRLWLFDYQYLQWIDLATGNTTVCFNTETDALGSDSKMIYDPIRDIFVVFLGSQASSVYGNAYVLYFDPDNPTDFIKAIQDNTVLRGKHGISFDADNNRILCWNGGADITVITPPSTGWNTNTWVSSTLTLSGTPSAAASNGTYGRFQYSSKYKCAFLLNTLGEKLWAVKLLDTNPPQYARPTSDVSAGTWTASTGSDLFAMLDETSANDSDYITTTSASTCEVALGSLTDPASSTGHIVRYRISATGGGIIVRLREGTTTIASWTHDPAPASLTTYSQTLSGSEADSITNYAALKLQFEATA